YGKGQHTQSEGIEYTTTSSKPKNIIFLIGDGMGLNQISAGLTANKGELNLELFKHIGLSKTYSSSSYITDSAAGATAFSIGKKTYNGAIGVDKDTIPTKTILEMAEENGLSTGLIATSSITHATPASFIAHQPSRKMEYEIAKDFLNTDIDVFIGGGKTFFADREDDRDLIGELKDKQYDVQFQLADVQASSSTKLVGLLADKGMPKISEGRGDMLAIATEKAITLLSQNDSGFFLVVEGSQIDWGGHANDIQYIIDEMLDFDKAVGKALEFAANDGNTLVVVTADHETGGLSLIDGNMEKGEVEAAFSTLHHTAVMVPVFAFGPQGEQFTGIYENTAIFDKFLTAFDFENTQ
ncbi:MAG: alkaline phosphatase, partial [Flammeovirgaceae bacterium]